MKRCVVLAAKILAEAAKDRMADEFLEVVDAVEKYGEKMTNLKCRMMTPTYEVWRKKFFEPLMLEIVKRKEEKKMKKRKAESE